MNTADQRVPAWLLAVVAMLTVQLGVGFSVHFFPIVGTAGIAWLRLTFGALIFLAIGRPRLRGHPWAVWRILIALGVATGLVTVFFMAAVDRIPQGTAVAIEFLGPLSVGVLRAHNRRLLAWPALAMLGVLLLTEPWRGEVDPLGVGLALGAAVCWGVYIVLTQQVGERFAGLSGLSITIPIAALTTAVVGLPQAAGHITWGVVLGAAGLALLMPVLPFSLEMLALRRLTTAAFGTLMALEPAFGALIGIVLLAQIPGPPQVVGVALVVAAGIGAERSGRRGPDIPDFPAMVE
ncbi:MAG: EamA family transporter [Candidatus Nanopelagicales bacterium]